MDQMIVMGKNYVTLHQFGETSKKEIGYENIVKIELKNMLLKITVFNGTKLNGTMDYRFYYFNHDSVHGNQQGF